MIAFECGDSPPLPSLQVVHATPADGSYVSAMRREGDGSGWCTVVSEGSLISFQCLPQPALPPAPEDHIQPSPHPHSILCCEDAYGGRNVVVALPEHRSTVIVKSHNSGGKITASSLGFVSVKHPEHISSVLLFQETSRTYMGNVVLRYLNHPIFIKDTYRSDGSRELFLRRSTEPLPDDDLLAFYVKLLSMLPNDCERVYFNADGSIVAFSRSGNETVEIPWNIRRVSVDGETGMRVSVFEDGRVTAAYPDGAFESFFPDDTRSMVHCSGKTVVFYRDSLPTVEVNLDFHRDAVAHSQGGTIPLARGREGVRMRVACPLDGSGLLIKYNTRVTASVRSYVVATSRDHCVLCANDNGQVRYWPRSSWDENSQRIAADSRDDSIPLTDGLTEHTFEKLSKVCRSLYKFNLLKGSAEIVDESVNIFRVDLRSAELLTARLSGEMDGMQTDVQATPSSAQFAFIVQADGQVMHLMGNDEFEHRASHPRLLKHRRTPRPPATFTPGDVVEEHMLIFDRKDIIPGRYAFQDVFPHRAWHCTDRTYPCSALAFSLKKIGRHGHDSKATLQVSSERLYCSEHPPMTRAKFAEFESDMVAWREFCDRRLHSSKEFEVVDFRSQGDIAREEQLRAKVKLLGKQLKQERKLAQLNNASTGDKRSKQVPNSGLSNIEEGVEDASSDVDFRSDLDSDDETDMFDPEALELNDAFSSFSEVLMEGEPINHGKITSLDKLRAAIVQLVNANVTIELLKEILDFERIEYHALALQQNQHFSGRQPRRGSLFNEVNITEEEFSRIFYRIRWIYGDRDEQSRIDSDDLQSRSAVLSPGIDAYGSIFDENSDPSGIDERLRPMTYPIPPLTRLDDENPAIVLDRPVGSGYNAAKVRMVSTT